MTIDDDLRTAADRLHHQVRATVDTDAALATVTTARPARSRWVAVAAALVLVAASAAAVGIATRDDGRVEVATETTVAPSLPAEAPDLAHGGPVDGTSSAQLPVTATPATDLVEGQEVAVTGEGFTPGEPVGVVMCVADALSSGAGSSGCDMTQVGTASVDAQGHAAGTIVVRRSLSTRAVGWVDCAAGEVACGIAIGQVSDYDVSGLAPVTFAPQPPLPPLVLTVSPAEGLENGQTVTVTGEGFVGEEPLDTAMQWQCADGGPDTDAPAYSGGPACLLGSSGAVVEDIARTDGRFTVELQVWRTIPTSGGAVDCAEAGCHLRVDWGGRTVTAPLRFDPALPAPPVPTMSATPTTDLAPGDEVVVTVEGLPAGQAVTVQGCGQLGTTAIVTEDGCPPAIALGDGVADETGRVTILVVAPDPAPYGVDCTRDGACGLTFFPGAMDGSGPGSGDPAIRPAAPVVLTYAP